MVSDIFGLFESRAGGKDGVDGNEQLLAATEKSLPLFCVQLELLTVTPEFSEDGDGGAKEGWQRGRR